MKRESMQDWERQRRSMADLGDRVRGLLRKRRYEECEEKIARAMAEYPHAAQPHNLMGALMELEGDHPAAMRHFRAAWALDPAYLPARYNMERTGSFAAGPCALDEADCAERRMA